MNHSPSRRLRACLFAAIVAAGLGFLSCMPEERHRVLVFFFDGVPPLYPEPGGAERPAAGKAVVSGTPAMPQPTTPIARVYEHKPGSDEKLCRTCHDPGNVFALVKPIGSLCVTCHERETHEFRRMHGPVAFGDCATCHEAHRSPYKHLVKAPAPKLCFFCHEHTPAGGKPLGCARSSDEVNCLTCHHPHGGADPVFLVGRAAAAPGKKSAVPSSKEAR